MMGVSFAPARGNGLAVTGGELTGALGDSITVLPIVVALAALTPLSLAHALLGFAGFQAVWGIRYGLPISVEPMKALAGFAIAGALTYGELVAAGLLAGVLLIAAGRIGLLERLADSLAEPVVRGVQLAVAALLALAGLDLAMADPGLAAAGLSAAVAGTLLHRRAGALTVLLVGTGVAVVATGTPGVRLPRIVVFPGTPSLSVAAVEGLAGQLAITVGNAAVATSLLFSDLYDVDVSPDELAESMGVTNLVAVPFGGVPMCHGSGGLAGKYAFGARTGGANLVLAVLYAVAALIAPVWEAFPQAMLGVLLVAVAGHMARVALDAADRWLVVGMAGLALVSNVGVAFLAGIGIHRVVDRWRAKGLLPTPAAAATT